MVQRRGGVRQRPTAAERRGPDGIGRSGDRGPGKRMHIGNKRLPHAAFGDIAAPEHHRGIGREMAAPSGDLGGVGGKGGRIQRAATERDRAGRAVGEELDIADIAQPGQCLGDLRDAVLIGVEQHDIDARLHPGHQFLPVRDTRIDEQHRLAKAAPQRGGRLEGGRRWLMPGAAGLMPEPMRAVSRVVTGRPGVVANGGHAAIEQVALLQHQLHSLVPTRMPCLPGRASTRWQRQTNKNATRRNRFEFYSLRWYRQ